MRLCHRLLLSLRTYCSLYIFDKLLNSCYSSNVRELNKELTRLPQFVRSVVMQSPSPIASVRNVNFRITILSVPE